MRYTIVIVAIVAVSCAAPLDKPADTVPSSSIAPIPEPSSTLAPIPGPSETPIPELSSTLASHEPLSSPAPVPEPSTIVPDHPVPAPQVNQHLPDQPINLAQGLEPNRLENPPPVQGRPEPNLPLPISPPHHVEEHGLNPHPGKPQKVPESELELTDEEIDFLETIGTLAVNYELALLQELEKEYELDHHGNKHNHGHHSHGHKHEHHNSPNKDDDDEDCDCGAAIFVLPEAEHPSKH